MKDIYDKLLEAELRAINLRYKFELALLLGIGVVAPLVFTAGVVVGAYYVFHK